VADLAAIQEALALTKDSDAAASRPSAAARSSTKKNKVLAQAVADSLRGEVNTHRGRRKALYVRQLQPLEMPQPAMQDRSTIFLFSSLSFPLRSALESEQMQNVTAHPAFKSNPVGTIVEHMKNIFALQRQQANAKAERAAEK
jgi:hypothetical protein